MKTHWIRRIMTPKEQWLALCEIIKDADYLAVLFAFLAIVAFIPLIIVVQPIRLIGNAILNMKEEK